MKPILGGLPILITMAVLSSCDPYIGRANNSLGVSLSSDGQDIEIEFALCAGRRVNSVELLDHRGGNAIGEDVDPILWKITSSSGSTLEHFTVGETPDGFVQVVPLTNQLESDTSLGVMVGSTQGVAVDAFMHSDLRPDRIFSGKSLSPSEFEEQAAKVCP